MELFNVYQLYPIDLVRAEGSYLWDSAGTRYLDLYGGHAVISIGHTHPHYTKSIEAQLHKLAFYSNSVQNTIQQALADKLGALSGYGDYALFVCNSGAEANENALKLASFHNGRKKVIAFTKSFHGRTEGAVAVTDNPKIIAPINQNENVYFLPFNDIEALTNKISEGDIAAVIVEGIQGVGGIHCASDEFLQAAQRLCSQYNTALILDEVQSGYGRSGRFFAHQHADIRPDLITVAKGMGNGFPIGAVLIAPHFKASYGLLGTTFGGNHLACAAALAVLEVIESENLIQNALTVGNYLIEELKKCKHVSQVRGKGLMIGITLDFDSTPIREKMLFEHHIFTGSSSDKFTIRLLPALNISLATADIFLETFVKVLEQQ